jgi:hypothetical protein
MNFETRIENNQVRLIGRDMAELKKEAKRLISEEGYGDGFQQGTDSDSGLYMVTLSKASKVDPKPKTKEKEGKK